jgi:hypothetical protein
MISAPDGEGLGAKPSALPTEQVGEPVTLGEAKLFLRVEGNGDDAVISELVDRARERVEAETGLALSPTSPAPLRLALLMLVLREYERGEEAAISHVESWIAPYRRPAKALPQQAAVLGSSLREGER